MSDRKIDRTALSYWFPKIEAAGLPVPRTIIVDMPEEAQRAIWSAFDGKEDGDPKPFFAQIARAADTFGFPCFLRTDHTSGKHSWERTCCLPSADAIPAHVFDIAEFSECCDLMGLPWDRWAVREMLPVAPVARCPRYGNMPVVREFRLFVEDGVVICCHPYWPERALIDGGANLGEAYAAFADPGEEREYLFDLAARAGEAVGGAWSVDLLATEDDWFITDMAEASRSFHWEGCPNG